MSAASIIEPPPKRNACDWADANRILPPGSPEPGPWRSSRTPYAIPIAEACSRSATRECVVVMGSQMGKTELELNILGHRFDDGPRLPALVIGPTEKWARSFGGDRLVKMIDSCKSLFEKLRKGQADKVLEKFIAGIRLGIGWAGSATELASHPAGLALMDEVDRMLRDVDGEGSPVEMVRARLKNYINSLLVAVSTPTVELASVIWAMFEEGTMGKWTWPCPHCDKGIIPQLSLLQWQGAKTKQEARKLAVVACPHCGGTIQTKHKARMNAQGYFTYHMLGENGQHIPVDYHPKNTTESFWVSGLASPWVTFEEMAERLFDAYQSRDQNRIQAVVNTYGGELFKVEGDAPDWEEVAKLRRHYERGSRPEGVQLITCGVDVQKRGLFYTVRGWGFNSESWLLDHGYIAGETEFDDVWLKLARLFDQDYRGMRIERMFVDSGYRPGDKWRKPDNQVYQFCMRHAGMAFPTKGHDTQDRPLKASMIDINSQGRTLKNGLQLWHLNTDYLKSWVHSRVRWPEDAADGGFHLHADTDEDYCRQIVAEEVIVTSSGKRMWKKTHEDNHYLDCESMALAAGMSLEMRTLSPVKRAPRNADRPDDAPQLNQRQSSSPFARRGMGARR